MNEAVREERVENLRIRVVELPRCDDPECSTCSIRDDLFLYWAGPQSRDRWLCIGDSDHVDESMGALTADRIALYERLAVAWGVIWEEVEGASNNTLLEMAGLYQGMIENLPEHRVRQLLGISVQQLESFSRMARTFLERSENAAWN